jgi:hypothetical protein
MEFENLQSRLENQIKANNELHSYSEDLHKNAETGYHRRTLEIHTHPSSLISFRPDSVDYPNQSLCPDTQNLSAKHNITALQNRASVAESRVLAAAVNNPKQSDDILAAVKPTVDTFLQEVRGKMETEFDKPTIWKWLPLWPNPSLPWMTDLPRGPRTFSGLRTETLTSTELTETSFKAMITCGLLPLYQVLKPLAISISPPLCRFQRVMTTPTRL